MLPWAPLMHSADGVESPIVSCDQLLSFTGVQGYRPQLHTVSSMKTVQLPSHPHGIVRKQKYDAAVQTSCKLPSAACTSGWKAEVSVRFGGLSKQRIPSVAARCARPWWERGIWQSGAAVVCVSSEVFRTTPLLLCMAAGLGVYLGPIYIGSFTHSLSGLAGCWPSVGAGVVDRCGLSPAGAFLLEFGVLPRCEVQELLRLSRSPVPTRMPFSFSTPSVSFGFLISHIS